MSNGTAPEMEEQLPENSPRNRVTSSEWAVIFARVLREANKGWAQTPLT